MADHHNVIIMKKLRILEELTKWDTDTMWANAIWKKAPMGLFHAVLPQVSLFVKKQSICEVQVW